MANPLAKDWPGAALFADAFATTLPRNPEPWVDPAGPDPWRTIATLPKVRRAKAVRVKDGTYVVKRTYHSARRGTKRANQLEIVLAYTTVRQARLAGAEQADINLALAWGLIEMVQP